MVLGWKPQSSQRRVSQPDLADTATTLVYRIIPTPLSKDLQDRPGHGKPKAAGGATVLGLGGVGAAFEEAQP